VTRSRPRRRIALSAATLLGLTLIAPTATAGQALEKQSPAKQSLAKQAPEKWETTVFAGVPAPGFPAYVFAHRNRRVYAGTYVDPDDSGTPSRVYEWRRDGTLLRSWRVPGQQLDQPHGIQVANQTRQGRLIVLETSTSTVRTLDTRTGRWRTVARLPGAIPNYASWGPGGALYVTDYGAGRIWRVSRRGKARVWFTAPELTGASTFGTTGIVYRKRERDLLITQQTTEDGNGVSPTQGFLYRLPIGAKSRPGQIETLWTSQPTDLPDGIGIGRRSGHVYIAMAGATNQIAQIDLRSGAEIDRFPDAPLSGENGSAIPFDTPCSATFLGTRILVANQSAVQADPSHQAILSVAVRERGVPTHLPRRPFLGG
jgi:sugar lactone lactonase YvrE